MSLKVWLPLLGDFENKGCGDIAPITLTSGNSWATTGKIGAKSLILTKLQSILGTNSCMSGAKQMSYAFWVKVNTAWETQWLDGIRWYSTDGTTNHSSRQEFYTNCTYVGTWYKGGSISGKMFVPGQWTHIAATFNYETGKVNFYLNGVLQGSTTNLDTTHYCRGDFSIGDTGTDICENDVRIYDHCLSAAEVHEIAQGLIMHYKLNDPMNGIEKDYLVENNLIIDSSGYGHQANLQTGTSSFTVDTAKYNSSLTTEETTCYKIQDTIFDSQHLASEFTWSGWIKRGYTAAETRYIYKGIVYIYLGDEFDIRIGWRHRNEDGSYDSNNAWAPGKIIPYNEWTHIIFTFKDGIMKLYVNSEYTRISDRSETGIYIRGYRNFYFPSNGGDSFVGNISDIRIYCTALLDTDIKLLYNIGSRIDNLGGVHAFEFNETSNENILKTGILQTNELEEISMIQTKLKKNKGWLSSNFIEI